MSIENEDRVGTTFPGATQRKAWSKPTIITAAVHDHTEDGGTTGTDDGNGINDYTLS